jgi:acyl-CoA synthetase (NDP forming)
MTARDLAALFDPRSVAVIGASEDPAKWGHQVAAQLLAAPGDRVVHLVNRRGVQILGRATVPSLREAGQVDLVAICVPAAGFLEAVDDALAAGARALVAITAGLGEAGPEGARIEAEAVRRVRAAGAVLVGPNCLGVVDTSSSLHLASDPLAPGHVAVLSQSGNVVIDLDDHLRARGLGISRFVSLGNQADLALPELMRACVHHEATSAVAVYAEDLGDGRAFVAAARALHAVGKPVVLLAPGRSAGASRGAASHTGALTSPSHVVDAACAAGGVHRVETPGRLVEALVALGAGLRAQGPRVGILTDGGGHGAIAADALAAVGLEVPVLSEGLGELLRAALWDRSPVTNPVDLAGVGEQDPLSYARGVRTLLDSDEVDAVLWIGYFGGYARAGGSLANAEIEAARMVAADGARRGKPLVVHSMFPDSPSVRVLADAGIPVFRDIDAAARALAVVAAATSASLLDPLDLPEPDAPVVDTGYVATRALVAAAGIEFPELAVVDDEAHLIATLRAGTPAYPVVLKAMGLLHKSDAGGVVLGLGDEKTAVAAYRDLVTRLSPPAVTVEAMAELSSGVEIIVGTQRDPRFGPVVLVGLGGVLTEVLADVAVALAPVSGATAEELVRSLRGAALLEGVRGRPAVNIGALAALVAAVSRLAAAHPEIAELELNPVLASASRVLALDARAILG